MTARPQDIPSGIRTARPSVYLFRAAAAHVRACLTRSTPEGAARQLFGNDIVTREVILRAATMPAETTTTGWAAELARLAIEDMVAQVASLSAAADVINRGTIVSLDGLGSIRIPGRVFAPNAADAGQWVAEGAPIPVRAQTFTSGASLVPRKLAVIVPFSREMAEASAIETIAKALISEAVGRALDAQMFSATAGDATKPPGLLVGLTPITAATGGGANAAGADIGALVEALALNYGGAHPVFIAAPRQAAALKLLAGPHFDYPVIASAALAAGTIIAIEIASFVSGFAAAPEFVATKGATIHMEDTAPADIVTPAGAVAVPVKSMFQTDTIALRMVMRASWGIRAPHVSFITGATW